MRTLLLALAAFVAVNAFVVQKNEILDELRNRVIPEEAQQLTGQALVDYVNQKQSFFKAAPSKFSKDQMKKKLMDVKYVAEGPDVEEIIIDADIPDRSDKYGLAVSGSCWAFGASEAMSDRICIASNGKTQVSISADDVLSCCGKKCGNGCEGGYPIEAWRYWVKTGICTGGSYTSQAGCKPYPIPPCGHHVNQTFYGDCPTSEYDTPVCTNKCIAGYSTSYADDKHFGELRQDVGGHAVKILGWGVDNKTPYWLVANSWNTDWGENGYFRIVRGVNECGIEHAIVAGLAKV
ncbi:unnamed protein product [Nippostrongylus brasiliensis]|uniref:Pept_C1 domain-containing protein n=1 Tax=Nippostrongylus brasiliensis TaxID=27835 RepID=A0A158R0E9_NIPBR|nr:unnamed protein product [Nippostrongylus brasiliensis]